MTALLAVNAVGGGRDGGKDATVAQGIATFLCLAATPTFAIMAALAGLPHAGPIELLCSMGPRSPLGGMVPMYVLMAAFHTPPWLRLIAGR